MRNEGDRLLEAVDEITNVRWRRICHFITKPQAGTGQGQRVLQRVDAALREATRDLDVYLYRRQDA